ncbi:MAG: hypothetical protein J1F20_06965 [Muribaculaceae bacterium]|nr:hypothetical protein [Muribaculaceae bacterium]
MERIKLSKNEKRLLRNIQSEVAYWPDGMSDEVVSCTATSLEAHGLIHVIWESGHIARDATLTETGIAYLVQNPQLYNPIDWVKIGAIAAIVSAIGMIAGLILACTKM